MEPGQRLLPLLAMFECARKRCFRDPALTIGVWPVCDSEHQLARTRVFFYLVVVARCFELHRCVNVRYLSVRHELVVNEHGSSH